MKIPPGSASTAGVTDLTSSMTISLTVTSSQTSGVWSLSAQAVLTTEPSGSEPVTSSAVMS